MLDVKAHSLGLQWMWAVCMCMLQVQAYSIKAVSVEGEVLSLRCTEQEGRSKHRRPSISKVEQAMQKHSAKPLHSRDSIFFIFSSSCCHKCYKKHAPTISCIIWINIRSERITWITWLQKVFSAYSSFKLCLIHIAIYNLHGLLLLTHSTMTHEIKWWCGLQKWRRRAKIAGKKRRDRPKKTTWKGPEFGIISNWNKTKSLDSIYCKTSRPM